MEAQYKIVKDSFSYLSHSNYEYEGTLKELLQIDDIKRIVGNHNPRTINGLKKLLQEYSKEHSTLYTSVNFEILEMY